MQTTRRLKALLAAFSGVVLAALLVGCAADGEVDNVSERPWNNTQGWQGGLPSSLNEGR